WHRGDDCLGRKLLVQPRDDVHVRRRLHAGTLPPPRAAAPPGPGAPDSLPPALLTLPVAGLLTLDASAKITAPGRAVAGDTIGPDGGTITLAAHDVSLAGAGGVSGEGFMG